MRDENDPRLSDFEAHLQTLAPTASVQARDRLLFEAGRRSHRRQLTAWRAGTVMLLALLVGHFYLAASQPQRGEGVQFIERPIANPHLVQASDAVPATPPASSYLVHRIRVLDTDGDAAGRRDPEASRGVPAVQMEVPVSYRALRQDL